MSFFNYVPSEGVEVIFNNGRTFHNFSDCSGNLQEKLFLLFGNRSRKFLFQEPFISYDRMVKRIVPTMVEINWLKECLEFHEFSTGPLKHYSWSYEDDEGIFMC